MAPAAHNPPHRTPTLVAAALLAVALLAGVYLTLGLTESMRGVGEGSDVEAQARRSVLFGWVGVAAAGVGLVLLAAAGLRLGPSAWLAAIAAVPGTYVIVHAAPDIVRTGDVGLVAVANWVHFMAAAGAVAALVMALRGMAWSRQYAMCCGALGVGAVFFAAYEPPPPKPLEARQPISRLVDALVPPGWVGRAMVLREDIEVALGADEYLNLEIRAENGEWQGLLFIPYNADAMTQIPHVPWVCMTQSGYVLEERHADSVPVAELGGREVPFNALLFRPGPELPENAPDALMFQYFNIGGTYTTDRQIARFLATTSSLGQRGSYLTQTQLAIYLSPGAGAGALEREHPAYRIGLRLLQHVAAVLEREYYPAPGGAARED